MEIPDFLWSGGRLHSSRLSQFVSILTKNMLIADATIVETSYPILFGL